MRSFFENLHRINKTANVYSILRRYFAMNAFDGTIVTLGVIMGAFVAGLQDPKIVMVTAIATSLALLVSGTWSTYITELAERKVSLHKLEKKMLRSLKNTKIGRASQTIALESAIVDGLSSSLVGFIVIIPFFFSYVGVIPVALAFQASVATALCLLFLLGAYLAKLSKQNFFVLGLKMVVVGIIAIAMSFLLGGL